MTKFKKLFMVIFAITMTTSICAQVKWEGKWTAKKGANTTAEFHLFSDNLAYIEINIIQDSQERNRSMKSKLEWSLWGKWTADNDHLNIDIIQNNSDVTILSSRGYSEWDKTAYIGAVTSGLKDLHEASYTIKSRNSNTNFTFANDMVMTKVNTNLPYYYVPPKAGKFQLIDLNDVPNACFLRGKYIEPNGDYQIGLFIRANVEINETSILTKKYNAKGEYLKTVDEDVVDSYRKPKELAIIDNIADAQNAPSEGSAEYTFSDGRQYNGMWSAHFPNGQGTMRYTNGNIIEGTWNKGKFVEGTATIIKEAGTYVGGYKEDNYEGQGRFDFKNGDYSEGLWQKGKFIEGTVSKTTQNGDKYVGGWKNDNYSGQGKYTYSNGSWEEGIFDGQNLVSGNAFIKNANGSTYTGEIKNNKREGNGTYTQGDYTLTGTWANDTIQQGKFAGPEYTYEGTFAKGKFVEGTYKFRAMTLSGTWKDQVFCKGDFKLDLSSDNAIKSAQGKYDELFPGMEGYKGIVEATCMADPLKLSGKYQKGMMEWTITYPNNDQYFGYYNGTYCYMAEENKEFKYTWADGTSATGIVDKKHKPTKLVYANPAGEPIKGKATKGYDMQLPTNDKTVDLPYGVYQSWKIMLQLFELKVAVPEIGGLYK